MPLYRLSDLKDFLDDVGVQAKRSMSQNFLVDGNIVKNSIDIAAVIADDVIVEIGSGPGVFTEELLCRGATVVAIEKDDVFARALTRLQTADNRLHIVADDALTTDITAHISPLLRGGAKAKIVASIPYSITTPLLQRCIALRDIFSCAVFIVQDDVASKAVSRPGDKNYSFLSVFLKNYCHVKYSFTIKNSCFYPRPKVSSAALSLEFRDEPLLSEELLGHVREAFLQRRKMLRSSLKEYYSSESIMAALESIGKPSTARPEELSLEDFVNIFQILIIDNEKQSHESFRRQDFSPQSHREHREK
ncbi:MAG: ribosomal RNA small subunit methyltransferase A [Waddliaceae bacterium]|jgi:16S rRNA (adenine1518-N6/adenine1519-N6)-dimethyltransferase|nr:ribosomal RNA small subunit methyltransferase A [Waddliaceae bacterium]MBT3578673.1 ribosomal RNA small subunit methyltransferase A [Waddliaceae bacterium]MBT4445392.1 ribosomal RNA small subunit methyltransferase A [Waddliaceae bacterium]MBT6928340.1 ribosomal RNA small subunit methyltransferase A [Waddliaceae bacterium]MBT7265026.1 ribosomal RNA small subunit methyltransferase A [Waddliaceae bacterium]